MEIKNPREYENIEMQMGPMIDIVFLLLVFFMVTAKPIKPEADISMSLPGTVPQEEMLDLPDEVQIRVIANGELRLNEMVVAKPDDKEMRELFTVLLRLRKAAEANRTEPLVTIAPDKDCRHQRIVDVLNTCAQAGIGGVTFTPAADPELYK